MIKYKLICKNCNNIFDSWFSNSKEYEKLKKEKIFELSYLRFSKNRKSSYGTKCVK